MALCSEVNDGARFVFVEQTGKVLQITGIGAFVEIYKGIDAPT